MRVLAVVLVLGPLAAQATRPDERSIGAQLLAIYGQHRTRSPEVVATLLRALRTSPHVVVRAAAAETLGTAQTGDVVGALGEVLANEADARVCQTVVTALGSLADPRVVPALIRVLPDRGVRLESARALAKLADQRAFEPLRQVYAEDNERETAAAIAEGLIAADRERAVPLLLERLAGRENWHLVGALASRPDPRVRAAMVRALREGDEYSIVVAIQVLGGMGDRDSVDALLELWHRAPYYRPAVVAALGRLGDPKVVNFLADELLVAHDPPDPSGREVRSAIAKALAELGDARVVPRLCAALERETDVTARVDFVAALARLGDPRAVATIASLLGEETRCGSPSAAVGAHAALAIQQLRDGKAPPPAGRLAPGREGTQKWLERITWPTMRAWWSEHENDPRWRFERR
jgi:HEAT repeat protein